MVGLGLSGRSMARRGLVRHGMVKILEERSLVRQGTVEFNEVDSGMLWWGRVW